MTHWRRLMLSVNAIWKLGVLNVGYVVWYRFTLASGFRKHIFPQKYFFDGGDFFRAVIKTPNYPKEWQGSLFADAQQIYNGQLRYYARHWQKIGSPPDWFCNPFNGARHPGAGTHWTELADFQASVGDIKNIWETSRFEWVVTLARAYRVCGDAIYLDCLNKYLADWCRNNPLNIGPNWKCGQEASIRVLNLLFAALILDQWQSPNPALEECLQFHLERISTNIRYAISQDNNHGTSEAAALFIAGHWLAGLAKSRAVVRKAVTFAKQGRRWLENRVARLVEKDGSFSQHSVTYHRLLLDTLALSEFWREKLAAEAFSDLFYQRSQAAVDWLSLMTDSSSGGAPNLGANDGALLLSAHGCDYRDFRPSLQTAAVLFTKKKYFAAGCWDEPLYWLGIDVLNFPLISQEKSDQLLPGGYAIMVGKNTWGMLRLPKYRFRPSHADALHLDIWHNGRNIIRDAGTYSYNCDNERMHYYPGTGSHSTVSFDGRDQMPRLGRFLFGAWLKPGVIEFSSEDSSVLSAYTDSEEASHSRKVVRLENGWRITDKISGFRDEAVIRWRLESGEWLLFDNTLSCGNVRLKFIGSMIFGLQLKKLPDSLYYLQEDLIPVVEVTCREAGEVTTEIIFVD